MSLLMSTKWFFYRTTLLSKWYFKTRGTTSFAKNNLDIKLASKMPYRDGFYIEIGANDGIQQSNSKYFEVFKGWRGVLIEPFVPNYELLRKKRSRKNIFFNCACVPFGYKSLEVELIYSDLMTTSLSLENDLESIEKHIEISQEYLRNGYVHQFSAPARTMNELLILCQAPQFIDFLSLDVEGAEIGVLQGIDHEQFRFKYILLECRDLNKMKEYLLLVGYELIEKISEHDYLFKNKMRPSL